MGGLTSIQALEIIRGCRSVDHVILVPMSSSFESLMLSSPHYLHKRCLIPSYKQSNISSVPFVNRGLNIVGCDLVEVAPMYDLSGATALLGANLLFEMLCVISSRKILSN